MGIGFYVEQTKIPNHENDTNEMNLYKMDFSFFAKK